MSPEPSSKPGQIMRLVRGQAKPKRLRIDHDKAVTTKSGIDRQGAKPFHFQRNGNLLRETGQVLHKDAPCLAP